MNGDTMIIAEEYAKEAGALINCPVCNEHLVSANDDDADRLAYAKATNAWKHGVRGFHGMEREEVMHLMKRVLQCSNNCPLRTFA